jgi:two-component sensor histidine kinase
MMSKLLTTVLLFILPIAVNSQNVDAWLGKLDSAIHQSASFDAAKLHRIAMLRDTQDNHSALGRYNLYLKLFDEFSSFSFDSAYRYASGLDSVANAMRDSARINYAKLKLGFIFLSSGMFKEVLEITETVDSKYLSQTEKAELYFLLARCYYDLIDYDHHLLYAPKYLPLAEKYLDSAIAILPAGSFESVYYKGLKEIRRGNVDKGEVYFNELSKYQNLSLHQQAVLASTYADVFSRRRKLDSSIILLAEAAISDLQTSTKETTAMQNLAISLYQQGRAERASTYIHKAIRDADFYGARQRILQISSVLPLIEGEMIRETNAEKRKIFIYAIGITSLVICLIVLAVITIRQNRKMAMQKNEIVAKTVFQQHVLKEKDELLEEKEFLLKEINHRIKNNLQLVMSLLNSQLTFLTNEEAIAAIQDSQHRIQSISLIHQRLYQSGSIEFVDLESYISELIHNLEQNFNINHHIKFNFDIESIKLHSSHAVPVALILNEAVTNCIKHAFSAGEPGQIWISIKLTEEKLIVMNIKDDGKGLPKDFDINERNSLGISLMQGLTKQLGGSFAMNGNRGVEIIITFPLKKYDDEQNTSILPKKISEIAG